MFVLKQQIRNKILNLTLFLLRWHYRLSSHFLPDLVLNQIKIPIPITEHIEKNIIIKSIRKGVHYRFSNHFLPDLVCDQITNAEPTTLVIKNIIVNASILFHFKILLAKLANI